MSYGGGIIHEGALTLGGCMWSLMDLYVLGFLCTPVSSTAPQVEALSDHCSSSLHSLVLMGH